MSDFHNTLIHLKFTGAIFFIVDNSKKVNVVGTADNECFVENEVHLTHSHRGCCLIRWSLIVWHNWLVEYIFFKVIFFYNEGLRLSINSINFICFFIMEAFLRIILLWALHFLGHRISYHFSLRNAVVEMPVGVL